MPKLPQVSRFAGELLQRIQRKGEHPNVGVSMLTLEYIDWLGGFRWTTRQLDSSRDEFSTSRHARRFSLVSAPKTQIVRTRGVFDNSKEC